MSLVYRWFTVVLIFGGSAKLNVYPGLLAETFSFFSRLRPSTLSNLNKTLDFLLSYLILPVTYLGFSTCITQNYLAYLITMHHLNRARLPSAMLLHGSVKRSNWREEFVVDLKGNGEGVGYLKIAYVSFSKTVLLISC